MWTSLQAQIAVETLLANGEVLQVQVIGDKFLKLRGKTRKPVMSKGDAQNFKTE